MHINTHTVKNSEEFVTKGTILRTVPPAIKVPQKTTPTRNPFVFISQHMGATNNTTDIVPQLAIMATVSDPQLGNAALTLSLRGPQVFHCRH